MPRMERIGLMGGIVFACLAPGAGAQALTAQDSLRVERMRKVEAQLAAILSREADSAAWKALDLHVRPKKDAPERVRHLYRYKSENMINLCSEERFATLAEIDSVRMLAAYDRAWCKERIKLLNPLAQ